MKKNDEERIKGERNEWREGRKEEKKKKKCDKKMTRWRKGEERMKKRGDERKWKDKYGYEKVCCMVAVNTKNDIFLIFDLFGKLKTYTQTQHQRDFWYFCFFGKQKTNQLDTFNIFFVLLIC